MASERRIVVGGVPIGGGAPVTRAVDDDHQDARRRGDDGADRPAASRPASTSCASPCPGLPDADALPEIVERTPRADHRRHPLQRLARAARDRRGRRRRAHQPRQHRRPRQGRAGRAQRAGDAARRCASARTPARCPSTCAGRRPPIPPARSSRAAMEEVEMLERLELPRLQDLGQVELACRS